MSKKSLRFIIPILCLLVVAPLVIWYFLRLPSLTINTDEKQYSFKIEIAQTQQQKELGLMHRVSLEDDRGMLFPYQEDLIPNFWMKNVLIPLDMIFITSDKKIAHIEEAVPCEPTAEGECRLYTPPVPVRYVLEIGGGLARKLGIGVGDSVNF